MTTKPHNQWGSAEIAQHTANTPDAPKTFHCPRWPRCGCPDGTMRVDCPGLKKQRMTGSTMKNAQIQFLKTLKNAPDGARRKDLPLADGDHGRVRQKLRQNGWCIFEDRGQGHRWFLTNVGEKALQDFMKREDG